ncbi:MAG TPA: hypothetical protein VG777_00240, partial [Thermoanaerobaculia bacterium]|nr:hypothetical protein [Thermoanaerobaculia bacterium]
MRTRIFPIALAIAASSAALFASPAPAPGPAPALPGGGPAPTAASPSPPEPSPAGGAASSARAFYTSRMQIGEQALSAGNAAEAADDLRVASFGLLDEPEKLSECLVWLAVAQQRARRSAEAETTLKRFQAVQALFPSWGRLALVPDIRSEFEALVRKRMPGMTLESPREASRAPEPRPDTRSAPAPPPPATPAPRPAAGAALRPAPLPVALGTPAAPPPTMAVPASLRSSSAPAPAPARRTPPARFDRELRTRSAVIFEIRPDQARLFVDGKYVGVSADWGGRGGRPFPLAPGEHTVRATLPGFRDVALRIAADPSAPSDALAAIELPRRERRSYRRIPPP